MYLACCATNRRQYKIQMLHLLDMHEKIHFRSAYIAWDREQNKNTNDDEFERIGRDSDTEGNGATDPKKIDAAILCTAVGSLAMRQAGHIKIAQRAPLLQIALQSIPMEYDIPDFISALCRFLELGDNGTSSGRTRWDYTIDSVPQTFATVDVWTSFRVTLPCINEFYPTETETIQCRPQGRTAAQFDPVLVVVQPSVTNIHSAYDNFSICSSLIC